MKIIIKKIKELDKQQTNDIKKFLISCFPDSPGFPIKVYTNPDLDVAIIGYDKGKIISHSSIIKRTILYKNKKYLVGGVGNVAVLKNERRQGIGTEIMRATNQTLKKFNYDLGLLFCHPDLIEFYVGAGWVEKEGRIYYSERGNLEHESTSLFYPLKLDPVDLNVWKTEEIHIGEDTW